MGTDCKSAAFQLRWFESTRAHQELQYPNRVLEFLFYLPYKRNARVDSNSNSDDRCQRQKQGGAVGAAASRMRVPPKARCSRWEPRPGLLFCAARDIHPRPPRTPVSEPGTGDSVLSAMQKGCKGRFEQYRFILSPTDIASAPDL